ncbi:MAG: NAD(P)H-binding protein [Flavobacteriales bacterium]|jgi:uncharacterized protein YbjT (DUF2867 family)|uniref:NAD(P)H-binding protein n=1 Tax=Candidatus Ulvibacter alkanivorans TaxID=2267620 RepID=UPI000DF34FF1|nr:NAD(P)H-binding protein [Candidatus Ulvibacter alkanivorans]MCH2489800.1 NAD(P)H-binding protein [Flavobacteriales bacterium]
MAKTAIILGATGLTGGILLELLLKDARYTTIKLFSRNSVERTHAKIEEHLIDLLALEKHQESFTGDVVFCCIGTTKSKTPNKEKYRQIDYGIPLTAAKLAKQNGITTFCVISAMGADASSSIFYNKIKGEMEDAVLEQQIENIYLLQPSLIGGAREEKRLGERMAQLVMKTFSFLIPKKYKIISPTTIAEAMIILASEKFSEKRIPSHRIKEIANDRN